ncbi:UvrD-helicase domain-containing protein [Staphylococcus gallinarum]|uniref:UvrD-helicase domain-containing protein n=1 Tax=Staphylococcus gallinarum TaxID=1293 RepID=UPI0024419A8F|nr:UvrD-helicase domain-containing protein [Staphylococcus gallinarum]MEB7038676.1 UvrD-helicase domain-containing protein [Staphylococcus gallinarum]
MSIPTLKGHQTEILYVADNQSMVITGSAGCGKSLLAIYRIYWLSKVYPNDKIVLLTFNRAVNQDMYLKIKNIANNRNEQIPDNLIIDTYNGFMKEILKKICDNFKNEELQLDKYRKNHNEVKSYNIFKNKVKQVKSAVDEISENYPNESTFNRPYQTFIDEISWMQQMSVTSLENYERIERIGRRSTRIERNKRKYFYEVYEQYKKIRENEDRYYDYEDIGTIIRKLFYKIKDQNKKEQLLSFKYILIDEFQDFTSDMLMTVNELSDPNGAMVLLGDINQGVFGKRISFKSLGINMKNYKKYQLIHNYRNSRPISEFAEKIALSPYFDKNNEFYTEGKLGIRKGQDPQIIRYRDEREEMKKVYQYIIAVRENRKEEKVGVILPSHKYYEFKKFMEENGLSYKEFNLYSDTNKIQFGTYKQIKGLEFDTVIMPFLSENNLKKCIEIDNNEIDLKDDNFDLSNLDFEMLEKIIAQYYVGVTRAREKLIILYSGKLTSLLSSLPLNKYICRGEDT